MIPHTLWNLFLAFVPVPLGYLTAWALQRKNSKRNLPLWAAVPLGVAWLVFLPNTCYLLTEWRHLLMDARWAGLRENGSADAHAMFSVAKWGLFFLAYSLVGVLAFTLSIRPMERWLRSIRQVFFFYAPPLFFLTSLGVYLGLLPRLNSWDIVSDPGAIWPRITNAVSSPAILGAIVVFGLILWATYEAVDLWLDGMADRLGFGKASKKSA
jgi:uncharacterized membrane protein